MHRPSAELAAAAVLRERCHPDKVLSLTLVVCRQAAPSVPGGASPLVFHRQQLVELKVGASTDPLVCVRWVLCARALAVDISASQGAHGTDPTGERCTSTR